MEVARCCAPLSGFYPNTEARSKGKHCAVWKCQSKANARTLKIKVNSTNSCRQKLLKSSFSK